ARPRVSRRRCRRAGTRRRRRPRPACTPRARVDRATGARGPVLTIRPLVAADAPVVLELQIRNKDFLAPYAPTHGADFYTPEAQAARIREPGRHSWLIVDGEEPVGFVGLSNVVRGP